MCFLNDAIFVYTTKAHGKLARKVVTVKEIEVPRGEMKWKINLLSLFWFMVKVNITKKQTVSQFVDPKIILPISFAIPYLEFLILIFL